MIRHVIHAIGGSAPAAHMVCGAVIARACGLRIGDVVTMGDKRHERDAGDACPECFGDANGYYAPFRGNDTMGVADKVGAHLIDGQQWPDIKAMSDDQGALIGYNVQFGPDHPPVHLAMQSEPRGPGFTIESLLAIAMHRLQGLNKKQPSAWNDAAIDKIRRGLEDLHDRTRDRRQRGVEGTHGA